MASPPDFATLTTLRPDEPGRFHGDITDTWQQGRGAFGGLVLAMLARAMLYHEDDERILRTLTADLFAPALVGPVDLRVETLRRGSHVSTKAARLVQGNEAVAHAVGVLARSRRSDWRWVGVSPPTRSLARDWREVPPASLPRASAPVFTRWFEFRPDGPLPFSGAARPEASGWIRLRHPGPVRDVAEIAALVDAWWPAHFAVGAAPHPIATISFTLDVVADVSAFDREAPLFHRGSVLAARDGYLVEQRELWLPSGELVALNTQTVAVLA